MCHIIKIQAYFVLIRRINVKKFSLKIFVGLVLCVLLFALCGCGEVIECVDSNFTTSESSGEVDSPATLATSATTEITTVETDETTTEDIAVATEVPPHEVPFNHVLSFDWAASYWEMRSVTELDLAEAENWGLAAIAGGFELTYAETYVVTVEEIEKSGAEFVYSDSTGRKIWVSFGDGMYFVAPAACNPCDLGLGQALLFSADGRPDRNLFLEGTLEAGNVKIYTYNIPEEEFLSFADGVFVFEVSPCEKKTSTELVFNPVSSYIAHDYGIGYAPIEDINAALSEAELPESLGGLTVTKADRSAREEEDLHIVYEGANGAWMDVIHCSKTGNTPYVTMELIVADEPTVSVLEKGCVVAYDCGNGTFCARMSRNGKFTYVTGYGMTREDFGFAVMAVLG